MNHVSCLKSSPVIITIILPILLYGTTVWGLCVCVCVFFSVSHLKANLIRSLTFWHRTAPALLMTPNDCTTPCMCVSSGEVTIPVYGKFDIIWKTSRNIATVFRCYCQLVLFFKRHILKQIYIIPYVLCYHPSSPYTNFCQWVLHFSDTFVCVLSSQMRCQISSVIFKRT